MSQFMHTNRGAKVLYCATLANLTGVESLFNRGRTGAMRARAWGRTGVGHVFARQF